MFTWEGRHNELVEEKASSNELSHIGEKPAQQEQGTELGSRAGYQQRELIYLKSWRSHILTFAQDTHRTLRSTYT